MKIFIGALLLIFFLSACGKDENRRSGVCYCEFVKGDDQQYDLSNLSRQEQINACNTHDSNAALFGGHCELE